jgi:hypothetical protein
MNRKKYEALFDKSYANKKSSMSKKQAANLIKQTTTNVATTPAIVPTTSTAVTKDEIKPCRACNQPIFFKSIIIKKKIAEEQLQISTVTVPHNQKDGQKHKCKYQKCKGCGEYIFFDPKRVRLVRESEKDRIKQDTIKIPINKKNNNKHICINGPLPKKDTCGKCNAKIFWNKNYYDDTAGQFIPLRQETGRVHLCGQDNEQEGIIIGAHKLSYHDGYTVY